MRTLMTVAVLAGAAAIAATAVAADPRGAATAPELAHGKQVFAHWCAPCHGPAPRLAGTLALQTKYKGDLPPALEDRTDLTPEVVAYFVRTGVAWMPPFRKTEVSDADLAELFITGTVTRGDADGMAVSKSGDAKCGRCWRLLPEVTEDGTLCHRCDDAVATLDKATENAA